MSINAWNPVCIQYLLLCPASFQAVKNNLCLKGMHKIWIHYRTGLLDHGPTTDGLITGVCLWSHHDRRHLIMCILMSAFMTDNVIYVITNRHWQKGHLIMDLQWMDFRLQNIFWSGSSAAEFEILYCHLIMRILMSTFRCMDNIDYVIMYRHLQKDNFHLFSLIWLMILPMMPVWSDVSWI